MLYDVAIIGGGPAGSQVACRLAGMGYGVVVLEKKEKLGEAVCCTGIISQECVTTFAIDEGVILRRVNSARVFSPSGRWLRLWRPEPQACVVDRPVFNAALAYRAQGKGAEYILNSPVTKIAVESDRVRVETVGERHLFEARAVVIATGFSPKPGEGLGLGKFGDFATGAQAEVETTGVDEIEVYLGQKVAPGFFAWLVPTSPRRALVGLLSRHRPGVYLKRLLSSLAAEGKIVSASAELSYAGIPLKPLARTYTDRLIVVGSAAGQVKPTTGGGIYYGLLCAELAADTLQWALKSDTLSARNLASYERAWKKKLGWELKVGYWARQFYQRLSDAQIERIVDIVQSRGIDQILFEAKDLSFDWHGGVVLRLIGHQALAKTIKAMRFPFPLRGLKKTR